MQIKIIVQVQPSPVKQADPVAREPVKQASPGGGVLSSLKAKFAGRGKVDRKAPPRPSEQVQADLGRMIEESSDPAGTYYRLRDHGRDAQVREGDPNGAHREIYLRAQREDLRQTLHRAVDAEAILSRPETISNGDTRKMVREFGIDPAVLDKPPRELPTSAATHPEFAGPRELAEHQRAVAASRATLQPQGLLRQSKAQRRPAPNTRIASSRTPSPVDSGYSSGSGTSSIRTPSNEPGARRKTVRFDLEANSSHGPLPQLPSGPSRVLVELPAGHHVHPMQPEIDRMIAELPVTLDSTAPDSALDSPTSETSRYSFDDAPVLFRFDAEKAVRRKPVSADFVAPLAFSRGPKRAPSLESAAKPEAPQLTAAQKESGMTAADLGFTRPSEPHPADRLSPDPTPYNSFDKKTGKILPQLDQGDFTW